MNYAHGVAEGSIPANRYRVLGCKRFLDDLKSGQYDFRPKDAEFVINIIEKTICHTQGEKIDGTPLAGTPFLLEPFHKFIVYNLLGFYIKGTDITRCHEAFIFIPRKNIKTTFAGALAWALSLLRRRSGSKTYITSAALPQSLESWNFIKLNVKRIDTDGDFRIIDNINELFPDSESSISSGYVGPIIGNFDSFLYDTGEDSGEDEEQTE